MHDAQALEQAGAFAIVLETMPAPLAELVTQRLRIPTIGIGAGAGCDGQVQVFHDLLGLFDAFMPQAREALRRDSATPSGRPSRAYAPDVRAGAFPTAKESFRMDPAALAELRPDAAAKMRKRHALGLDS